MCINITTYAIIEKGGEKMNEYAVLFCTVPKMEDGERIAEELVQKGFAACVNIVGGVKSVYKWKGEICRDDELLLIIKSRNELFEGIRGIILSNHPYEVPEIISLPISEGHDEYLNWIGEVTL
jgi:periplasmic divalent cation tolerance protein